MQGPGQRRAPAGGPSRTAGEPKAPLGRRDLDVNRERLVFCLTSLVGHRATLKLRNNVTYEGLFHSCAIDGDYSITLKSARQLPTEGGKAGDIIDTLLIPGKNFLQVIADDIPPLQGVDDSERARASGRFAIDADIARDRGPDGERELVGWSGGDAEVDTAGCLDAAEGGEEWDQFERNEKLFGVSTTFSEELYTTKLDPSSISRKKRDEADRIAREIESGHSHADLENRLEGEGDDDDEEQRFSAVNGTGANSRRQLETSHTRADRDAPVTSSEVALLPTVPPPKDHQGLSHLPEGENVARDHRISEMKRINALNLEPTSFPKVGDKDRQVKLSATRAAAKPAQASSDLKSEFQQSLARIKGWESSRNAGGVGPVSPNALVGGGAGGQADRKFSFNAEAKAFTLQAQAPVFTPGAAQASGMAAAQKPAGPSPEFPTYSGNSTLSKKSLALILEPFLERATRDNPEGTEPNWPEANGPSFYEILGQPDPSNLFTMAPGGPGGAPMPGAWQHQGQGGPMPGMPPGGAAPQPQMQQAMMQMAGGAGGQPGQMFPQMYPAQGGPQGNAMPGQQGGPQGGGGGGPPSQGQQPGQPHAFNQQMMMGQTQGGQTMVMPANMMAMQGGQGAGMPMGAMPKFGNQPGMMMMPVMMGPGGQFQQGFMPQQAVPGDQQAQQPPQGGMQQGGMQQGGMQQGGMQQGGMQQGGMQQGGMQQGGMQQGGMQQGMMNQMQQQQQMYRPMGPGNGPGPPHGQQMGYKGSG